MKVQVEELSSIERKLSIEVPPELVRAELDKAYTQLSRQVKVAGFRPGKVPRRILEQRYREQVEDDVLQRVVERSYLKAISEHNVEAVSRPRVTPGGALKPDEPFTYEARVEVKPKLEVKEYRDLPLKKADRAVDDARVAEQLEQMRESGSRLEPLEDRQVAHAGDFAVVHYEVSVDGKPLPESKSEDVTVEVAPGDLIEGKVAALEGLTVGSAKDIDYAFPPEYRVEAMRGKVGQFHITLRALKRKVVPVLDDGFAKEVGQGVETLEDLRGQVRRGLERAALAKAEGEERDALLGALIERNPFEVPAAMVEHAIDVMLDGALRNLARSGLDPQTLNLDFNHLREELRERAVKEVKSSLLLEAMAVQENISVSDEELDARIVRLAEEMGQPLGPVKKRYRDAEAKNSLRIRTREEKSVEFLRAHAKYS